MSAVGYFCQSKTSIYITRTISFVSAPLTYTIQPAPIRVDLLYLSDMETRVLTHSDSCPISHVTAVFRAVTGRIQTVVQVVVFRLFSTNSIVSSSAFKAYLSKVHSLTLK